MARRPGLSLAFENHNTTYIGIYAPWGNRAELFGITERDWQRPFWCLGQPKSGKSTLLVNMAVQRIHAGNHVVFIDFDGQAAKLLLEQGSGRDTCKNRSQRNF